MRSIASIEKRKNMTKKIAVINDLSGFGKCSLTAAIPTISVMGVQACPLPTMVLSAQTGFASYYCDDYTEKMEYFRQEWEKMGAHFEGIYTGFVGSEAQIQQIFRFLDTFYKKEDLNLEKGKKKDNGSGSSSSNTFLLVDPIMGDEGVRFPFCTDPLLDGMKELVSRADVVTPNLMELCLLTDTIFSKEMSLKEIEDLAKKVLDQGVSTVIVTGIRLKEEVQDDTKEDAQEAARIGNLTVTKEKTELSSFPYVGGSFSGTGDLFASVVAGGIVRGDDVFSVVKLAGEFIWKAMKDSATENVPRNEGANFEKYLGMLLP